jgi:regulation of enolase protein 1 (concanavalin A-like superfamily)
VGNSISYYHSADGKSWYVSAPAQTIATLKEEALVGIAATSHDDPNTAEATFDTLDLRPGSALINGVQACGGDKSAVLSWTALPGAESYNIYRAPAGTTDSSKFVKVHGDTVVAGTTYTDTSAGLVNGTPVLYALAPVTGGVEGDRVLSSVTPDPFSGKAPPEGFTTASFREAFPCGVGAQVDPATGIITVRGSGDDIWNAADGFNFTQKEVSGNFVVTVKALTRPSATDVWSKAGLMIREGLENGSRNAYFVISNANGLGLQWRLEKDTGAAWSFATVPDADLTLPIWLRMTRDGDNIKAEYSTDDGKTWQGGDNDENNVVIDGLAAKVNAGICITAHNAGLISEAKFSDLSIK